MKSRLLFFTIWMLFFGFYGRTQRSDRALQRQLDTLIKGFHGNVGLYIYDLKKDKYAAINADTVFSTASIVKIPILIGIMDRIRKGELDYHQRLTYTDSLYYKYGDDILSDFKNGSTIELSKVMMLSLTISDNCASLWLQGLAGGAARINEILDSLGFRETRDNSRTPGREAARERYGWGQTTPREMAFLMRRIVRGEVFGKDAGDKMLRLLSRPYWDEVAISQIPAGVFVADKNGALDENRNEILFVNAKHPYIVSVFTRNNADTSWNYQTNEAWRLIRKVSAAVYGYYNPGSGPANIMWEK
ncbi:MAG: class A beta-lactamase-related serine hydrolase [Puia sp.]|nr:class A beta-lactamase-related serine hydrolase [Puia sp.]